MSGNRKYGRNINSPAAKRYKAEDRCNKNKKKNIEKAVKIAKKGKMPKTPKGFARAIRREMIV